MFLTRPDARRYRRAPRNSERFRVLPGARPKRYFENASTSLTCESCPMPPLAAETGSICRAERLARLLRRCRQAQDVRDFKVQEKNRRSATRMFAA